MIKFNHFLLTISSALNIIIYSYNERFPGKSKVETLKSSLYRISSSVQFLEYFARNTTISALQANNLRLNNSKVFKYLRLSEIPMIQYKIDRIKFKKTDQNIIESFKICFGFL